MAKLSAGLTVRGQNQFLRFYQAFRDSRDPTVKRQLAAKLRALFMANPGVPYVPELHYGEEDE